MPNRWRQTLARLQAGDSEKEVAVRLGISRHTVHTYVKGLYRRFDVESRGELLAHCRRLARRDDFRPRLVLASGANLGP